MNWPWNRNKELDALPVNKPPDGSIGIKDSESMGVPFHAELDGGNVAGAGRLDIYSETWIYIRDYCLTRLDDMRKSNDNPNLDDLSTAILRGRIQFAKEIFELPNPKPTAPEPELDEED
jgi:hypothetical protein